MLNEQLDNSREVSENVDGPGFDLGQHSHMEILDRKCHGPRLAIMRTTVNCYYRKEDDERLLQDRWSRVTDTVIPKEEAFDKIKAMMLPRWRQA